MALGTLYTIRMFAKVEGCKVSHRRAGGGMGAFAADMLKSF
jgi:hypothetical protein